jgi:hypothetical protein
MSVLLPGPTQSHTNPLTITRTFLPSVFLICASHLQEDAAALVKSNPAILNWNTIITVTVTVTVTWFRNCLNTP